MAKQDLRTVHETPIPKANFSTAPNRNWLFVGGAVILLFLFFLMGAAAATRHYHIYDQPGMISFRTDGGFGARMHERGISTGGQVNDGQTRLEGVVTSVNGGNFTVSGHGATTNVTTSSSTRYQGGNTVKQYDTVLVYGTISDNGLSATHIVINP